MTRAVLDPWFGGAIMTQPCQLMPPASMLKHEQSIMQKSSDRLTIDQHLRNAFRGKLAWPKIHDNQALQPWAAYWHILESQVVLPVWRVSIMWRNKTPPMEYVTA